MHPYKGEVILVIDEFTEIPATVVASVLNKVDKMYHYNLTAQITDGSSVATVQIKDVLETFIIGKEEE